MSEEPRRRRRRSRSSPLEKKLRGFKTVQILRKDRLFGIAAIVVGLVVLAAVAAVPKVWRTTPKDFPGNPVEVSIIDLVQAWSLSRAAAAAGAAHEYDAALDHWRAADANNEGDPRIQRGILRTLLANPVIKVENQALIQPTVRRLMALTSTNSADVILSSEVLERYGQPEPALRLLKNLPSDSGNTIDQHRARVLLSSGRLDEFASLWRAHGNAWAADAQGLALYHDTWLMATNAPSEGLEAARRLRTALREPGETGLTAARLLQQAASQRGLVDDLALAITRLKEGNAAAIANDFRYWVLLAASGREKEARAQALAFRGIFPTPESMVPYIEALGALGLHTVAQSFLEERIGNYATTLVVWRAYFDLLADKKDWDELRRVASSARLLASRTDPLQAEAVFADFRGAVGQNRKSDVKTMLRELTSMELADPVAATRIAATLRQAGYPEESLTFLKGIEHSQAGIDTFWNEYFATGYMLRDLAILRRAVDKLLLSSPGSPISKNNQAELLLITGEHPADVLPLTQEGLDRNPDSALHQIHHALALLQNARPRDAAALLHKIDPSQLAPEMASLYHLALTQVHAASGNTADLLESARRINRSHLWPQQIERLDALLPAGAGR